MSKFKALSHSDQIASDNAKELSRALSKADCILYEYGLSLRDLSFK